MTPKERAVVRARRGLAEAIEEWERKIRGSLTALGDSCTHPVTRPYPWEHDDGYGTQSKRVGQQCKVCLKVDLWDQHAWRNP